MGECVFGRIAGGLFAILMMGACVGLLGEEELKNPKSYAALIDDRAERLSAEGDEPVVAENPTEIAMSRILEAVDQLVDGEHSPEKVDVLKMLFNTAAELNGISLVSYLDGRSESLPVYLRDLAIRVCVEKDLDQVWAHCTSEDSFRRKGEFGQKATIHSLIDWMSFEDVQRYSQKTESMPEELREFARRAFETRKNAVAASLNPERLKANSDYRRSLRGSTFSVGNLDGKNPALVSMIFDEHGAPLKEGSVAIGTFMEAPEKWIALGDLGAIKRGFRQFGYTVPMGFNKLPGLYRQVVSSTLEESVFAGSLFYTVIGNGKTLAESDRLFIYRHRVGEHLRFDMLITDGGDVLLGEKAAGKFMGNDFTGYRLVELKPAA